MPKSIRIRTQLGVDRNINVKVDQDFDFLEILSLKLKQEDVYTTFCSDYGVVAGRVIANGGYGVPNVHVSIFIPIDSIDENDPVISTLYPYKSPEEKNEDGYRYNLLPYENEYYGHAATGTFLGLSLGTVALVVGGTILCVFGIKKLASSKEKKTKTK